MKISIYCVVFFLSVSYIAFFYKLGDLKFVGSDEQRYAEVAKEMMETGDFLVPKLDNRPWFEKPPLYYWITSASFKLFGVSEFSARLSSALLAFISVIIVYFLGRKAFSLRAGLCTALILSTSPEYFILGRGASTDSSFSAMLTIGLACFYLGLLMNRPLKFFFSFGAYAFFGLATLAKGPVGLIFPVLIILLYLFVTGEYDRIYEMNILTGCVISLAVACPWYFLIIEKHRFNFIATFFLNHNLARFFTPIHHHVHPFYYFFIVVFIGFLPWSSFFPAIFKRVASVNFKIPDPQEKTFLFLWIWILVPFLIFSLSKSKLPGYILPVMPPLALLMGKEWDEYLERKKNSGIMSYCMNLYTGFALLLAVGIPLFLESKYAVPLYKGMSFFCLFLFSAGFMFYFRGRRIKLGQFLNPVVTVVIFVMLVSHLVFGYIDRQS